MSVSGRQAVATVVEGAGREHLPQQVAREPRRRVGLQLEPGSSRPRVSQVGWGASSQCSAQARRQVLAEGPRDRFRRGAAMFSQAATCTRPGVLSPMRV